MLDIDWPQLTNWLVQAIISFAFGVVGTLVGFQLSLRMERGKKAVEKRERLRDLLKGGELGVGTVTEAIRRADRDITASSGFPTGRLGGDVPPGAFESYRVKNANYAASVFALLWISTADRPAYQAIYIHPPVVSLGRASNNDVVLLDPSVARKHALIHCTKEGFFLEPISLASDTRLNGAALPVEAKHVLKFGDIITLGSRVIIQFRSPQLDGVDRIGPADGYIENDPPSRSDMTNGQMPWPP
jgi:hypothetical protein